MIYISLSTVPKRINVWNSFKQNIEALVNQNTDKEYKVLLNIPYIYAANGINEEYKISPELAEFAKNNDRLVINRVEKDYGPVCKLTGALEYTQDPDDILIVCDDDHVYRDDMIDYHVKMREKYPEDVITFRGDVLLEKRSWEKDGKKYYKYWSSHRYFPVQKKIYVLIPGHYHSVGYKRSFLEDDFMQDKDNHLSTIDNDDVHVGYYMKKKQREIICVPWEGEKDWRPVNTLGRNQVSFPILRPVSYPEKAGFSEFRDLPESGNLARMPQDVHDFLFDHSIVYEEN